MCESLHVYSVILSPTLTLNSLYFAARNRHYGPHDEHRSFQVLRALRDPSLRWVYTGDPNVAVGKKQPFGLAKSTRGVSTKP